MYSSFHRCLRSNPKHITIAATSTMVVMGLISSTDPPRSLQLKSKPDFSVFDVSSCSCDSSQETRSSQLQRNQGHRNISESKNFEESTVIHSPSLWNRALATIGIFTLPRVLMANDPVFRIPKRFLRKRQSDEEKMRKLISEDVPKLTNDPNFEKKIAELRQEIFELAYGKGVTAQAREDFLIRYGCTGFNSITVQRVVDLCATRGVVEVGAGHGQWQKALTDAYIAARDMTGTGKQFDFVLAYDNNSNLPLNTHIYNQYTQPHHDHFGVVHTTDSDEGLRKILRSWACRGRALLMVYPPPGTMALDAVTTYSEASPENDTVIYVGEGRGGANGDDAFFDFLENGEWMIIDILEVLRPPGDKGCEKMFLIQKKRK